MRLPGYCVEVRVLGPWVCLRVNRIPAFNCSRRFRWGLRNETKESREQLLSRRGLYVLSEAQLSQKCGVSQRWQKPAQPLKQTVLHSPEFPSGISEHGNSLHLDVLSRADLVTYHRSQQQQRPPQYTWVITVKMHLYQVKIKDAEQKCTCALFSRSSGHGFLYRHINEFHNTRKKNTNHLRNLQWSLVLLKRLDKNTCGLLTASQINQVIVLPFRLKCSSITDVPHLQGDKNIHGFFIGNHHYPHPIHFTGLRFAQQKR